MSGEWLASLPVSPISRGGTRVKVVSGILRTHDRQLGRAIAERRKLAGEL